MQAGRLAVAICTIWELYAQRMGRRCAGLADLVVEAADRLPGSVEMAYFWATSLPGLADALRALGLRLSRPLSWER